MQEPSRATGRVKTHEDFVERARGLAPLLKETAREAEVARRPLDRVINAVGESGLFSMMVPKVYGGAEADIDTFFEVSLELSRADASMGWLIGFYIEHNVWLCSFPPAFQRELFANREYILAPGAINPGAGLATQTEGGYRLSGQWQWGTGIVHAEWVMAGAMVSEAEGQPFPVYFVVPRDQTEVIDTWYVSGMCGTGSLDFKIDDVFVPADRAVPFPDLLNGTTDGKRMHQSPLYRTPLMPILALTAGLPILGAAQMALEEYRTQTKEKIEKNQLRLGRVSYEVGKPAVVARAAITIEAAELLFRDVLADVMAQRDAATLETRSAWLTRLAHATQMCREAVQEICSVSGASGSRLDNPIQRAMRDINTASNHIAFDRETRYAEFGRILLDLPLQATQV